MTVTLDAPPYEDDYAAPTGPQPSHDLAAEKSVLGAMLMSEQAVSKVIDAVESTDFYLPRHCAIFDAIAAMNAAGEPVDAVTVSTELDKRGLLMKAGGGPYLLELLSFTPTAANAESYARIVASRAQVRRMGELGVKLRQLSLTNATDVDELNELLAQGEQFFRKEHQSDSRALTFEAMAASWEQWQQTHEGSIKTPWDKLNELMNGGMQRGRIYTVGARPGVGKSIVALNIAYNAAFWGYGSAVFSLEMNANEVASRIIAQGANANLGQIMRKEIDEHTRVKITKFIDEQAGINLQVIDRERITVEQIVAHCRTLQNIDVVVIDYLQLLTPSDKKAPREQQVAHMSRALKIAARELNVAIVLCCQLNRGSVKDGLMRAPTIGDLRESGAIEQDSDCVILLHKDEDDPGNTRMIVGKNRQGKTGDIVLLFDRSRARLV